MVAGLSVKRLSTDLGEMRGSRNRHRPADALGLST